MVIMTVSAGNPSDAVLKGRKFDLGREHRAAQFENLPGCRPGAIA